MNMSLAFGLFMPIMFRNAGAGSEGGQLTPEQQQAALLGKITDQVKQEIQTRGFKNETEIQSLIQSALTGLDLEALRSFKPASVSSSVQNIAAQLEKLEQRASTLGGGGNVNVLRNLIESEDTMKLMERAFNKTNRETVTLNVRAAAIMTTVDAIDNDNTPRDIVESFSVDSFIKRRRPTEYIFDIADRVTVQDITEYKTWLEEGGEEGTFAIVTEGGLKPLVSADLVRNESKYKKIAGKRVYTEEFAKFRKEAYRIIEQLLNDKLVRDYSAILTTDLVSKAATYVGTSLDDQFVNPTDYHAVGAVAAQIEALSFNPDVLIINPQDKWRIALGQDTTGAFFVNIPMYNPNGDVQMMGFRVVTSNRIPVGAAILGEGRLYKIEDEPVQIRLGYGINVTKNGEGLVTDVTSDVDTNRFRIIAETFFHNYIGSNYTGSFVYFNFAAVKAALLKP